MTEQLNPSLLNLEVGSQPILGIGVDIIEPNRVGKDVENNPLFAEEFCTPEEISFCAMVSGEKRRRRYARCFSLKEAVIKTLGGGGDTGEELELDWREIVIENDGDLGLINLMGRAKRRADQQGITSISYTFTEAKGVPIVFCVAHGHST